MLRSLFQMKILMNQFFPTMTMQPLNFLSLLIKSLFLDRKFTTKQVVLLKHLLTEADLAVVRPLMRRLAPLYFLLQALPTYDCFQRYKFFLGIIFAFFQLKSRHVELIEQRMRDIKLGYTNREWLPKKENGNNFFDLGWMIRWCILYAFLDNRKKEKGCPNGCTCAKCYLDAEAYLKASEYIAQHREDDDHFLQEKMGKLASIPTGRCHLSTAVKANSTLGCAAKSSNHQVGFSLSLHCRIG